MRPVLVMTALTAAIAVPRSQKVYRATDSDFIARYQEVVRDTAEWRHVWALSGGRPNAAGKVARVPNINFKRKMVIVSTSTGTLGDSVVVQLDKGKGMYVVVTYRACTAGARRTMPIDIIAVPADPGSVLFRDKTVKGSGCPAA